MSISRLICTLPITWSQKQGGWKKRKTQKEKKVTKRKKEKMPGQIRSCDVNIFFFRKSEIRNFQLASICFLYALSSCLQKKSIKGTQISDIISSCKTSGGSPYFASVHDHQGLHQAWAELVSHQASAVGPSLGIQKRKSPLLRMRSSMLSSKPAASHGYVATNFRFDPPMWDCIDWRNTRWSKSESSVQMNVICLILLQLSRHQRSWACCLFLKVWSESADLSLFAML